MIKTTIHSSSMANKTVSFRIPIELIELLENQVKITGKSKTSLIVEALTQAFGDLQAAPETITISSLQHQLQALEKRVTVLSSQLAEERLKTRVRPPRIYNSKLLDQAVVSFRALNPTAAHLQENSSVFEAGENLTAIAEER